MKLYSEWLRSNQDIVDRRSRISLFANEILQKPEEWLELDRTWNAAEGHERIGCREREPAGLKGFLRDLKTAVVYISHANGTLRKDKISAVVVAAVLKNLSTAVEHGDEGLVRFLLHVHRAVYEVYHCSSVVTTSRKSNGRVSRTKYSVHMRRCDVWLGEISAFEEARRFPSSSFMVPGLYEPPSAVRSVLESQELVPGSGLKPIPNALCLGNSYTYAEFGLTGEGNLSLFTSDHFVLGMVCLNCKSRS